MEVPVTGSRWPATSAHPHEDEEVAAPSPVKRWGWDAEERASVLGWPEDAAARRLQCGSSLVVLHYHCLLAAPAASISSDFYSAKVERYIR